MKAIILAAGYATRLYPLTLNQPKHLLKVANKHVLDYSMEKLEKVRSIDHIYLVTNDKFNSNFQNWQSKLSFSKPINIINDGTIENQTKLGAIGDLNFVIQKENLDDDLLVIAGDNIFEFELVDIVSEFENKKKNMLAVYDVQDLEIAKGLGIVEVNSQNIITNFIEKPQHPPSTLASTGVYLFLKDSLKLIKQYLDEKNNPDRPGDYISWLFKKETVRAYSFSGKWFDIGNHSQLEEADDYFQNKDS